MCYINVSGECCSTLTGRMVFAQRETLLIVIYLCAAACRKCIMEESSTDRSCSGGLCHCIWHPLWGNVSCSTLPLQCKVMYTTKNQILSLNTNHLGYSVITLSTVCHFCCKLSPVIKEKQKVRVGGSWELSWLFKLPLLLMKSWHDAGRNVHRRGNVLFTLYLVRFSHFLYFLFPTTALNRELNIMIQTFIHTLVASQFTSVSVRIVCM